jgi:hypothetical protein
MVSPMLAVCDTITLPEDSEHTLLLVLLLVLLLLLNR